MSFLSPGRMTRWCSSVWPPSRRSIASSVWQPRDSATVCATWSPRLKRRCESQKHRIRSPSDKIQPINLPPVSISVSISYLHASANVLDELLWDYLNVPQYWLRGRGLHYVKKKKSFDALWYSVNSSGWLTMTSNRTKKDSSGCSCLISQETIELATFNSGNFHSANHLQSQRVYSNPLPLHSPSLWHHQHSRELSSPQAHRIVVPAAAEVHSNQADGVCDVITIFVFLLQLFANLFPPRLLAPFPVADRLCVPPVGGLRHTVPPLLRILGHLEGPTRLIGALFRKSCGRGIVFIHFLPPKSFSKPRVGDKCSCCGKESGVHAWAGWWRGARRRGKELWRCTWRSGRGLLSAGWSQVLTPHSLGFDEAWQPAAGQSYKSENARSTRSDGARRECDVAACTGSPGRLFLIIRGKIMRWANMWRWCLA